MKKFQRDYRNQFLLTSEKINSEELLAAIEAENCGAVVVFEGRVRNHNLKRQVQSLVYEVYEELASSEGRKILHEALSRFGVEAIAAVHRFGKLQLQEIAVAIVVVSGHRDEAFAACRFVIDEIKGRLPIWKQEIYVDHAPEWVGCPRCANHGIHVEHTS